MGIFTVECVVCRKSFQWFSGNTTTAQICNECTNSEKTEDKITSDQYQVNLLNKIISVQEEFIKFLKLEVERLKLSQIYIGPPAPLTTPGTPGQPYINPYQPFVPSSPAQPGFPLTPPYVVTCGGAGGVVIPEIHVGDPPGSVGCGTAGSYNIPFKATNLK